MRVAVLSQTAIGDDPRVRKQVELLLDRGDDVLPIGVTGGRPLPSVRAHEVKGPTRTTIGNLTLAMRLVSGRVHRSLVGAAYWSLRFNREMYEVAARWRPDLVHANDWRVLPIATRLAEEVGARVVYDSHEWAIEEQLDQARWRMFFPPFIREIERSHIGAASAVITVADGIAELYQREYGLCIRPDVIRNVPPYEPMELRPTSRDEVAVLYQGVFNPNRGLAGIIASVPDWPPTHRLILRGLGSTAQVAELRRLVESSPANDRITLEGPVPSDEMVRAAHGADVGIHALPAVSRQTRFALPNKLFEYMMAGLAVCVTDAPEMARVVAEHGTGVLLANVEPSTIAAAMHSLDAAAVNDFKRRSIEAAKVLNWDAERDRLAAIYDRVAA